MRQIISLCLLLGMLAGCATPASLQLTAKVDPYSMSRDPSKGLIYVYRERDHWGSARGMYIRAGDKRIGGVNTGTYFVYEVAPGEVLIEAENTLDPKASVKRTISVMSGGSYYIRGSLKAGSWDAMPYIEIVNKMEGEQAVLGLSYETM